MANPLRCIHSMPAQTFSFSLNSGYSRYYPLSVAFENVRVAIVTNPVTNFAVQTGRATESEGERSTGHISHAIQLTLQNLQE
jgi:hypothetical protein